MAHYMHFNSKKGVDMLASIRVGQQQLQWDEHSAAHSACRTHLSTYIALECVGQESKSLLRMFFVWMTELT